MVERSYYFKTKEEIVRYGISPNEIFDDDPQCIPVSKEEYNEEMAKLEAKVREEIEIAEAEEQSYVEQLEKENASLLYQVLTGEELISNGTV